MNNEYESFEKDIEEKFQKLKNEFIIPKSLNLEDILIKEQNKHKPIISRKFCAICCLLILFCVIGKPVLANVIQSIFAKESIDPGVIDAKVTGGDWQFKFNAEVTGGDLQCKFNDTTIPSEEIIINQKCTSDNVELQIDKIKLTATNTILEGTLTMKDADLGLKATLKNENGTIIRSDSSEVRLKEFKMQFPTIEITDKLFLELYDFDNKQLLYMIIDMPN